MAKVFAVEMSVNVDGLHSLPDGVKGPIGVFFSVVVQAFVKWGKDKNGMVWEEQAQFRQIRAKMEACMNTNEVKLRLTPEEYQYLTQVFKEAKLDPTANEVVYRVGGLIFGAKQEDYEEKKA